MRIIITSLGRPWSQHTLARFPDSIADRVELWVQAHEYDLYSSIYEGVHTLPERIRRLGPTREWLVRRYWGEKIVLMDDDLSFLWRRDPTDWRLTVPPPDALERMFAEVEAALDRYAHVGISGREGNNRVRSHSEECTRYMRVLCYNTAMFPDRTVVDRLDGMSDFDTCLQLLRAGLQSLVYFGWAQGQGHTQAPGGCAVYRTHDSHTAEVLALCELHPGLVVPVQKQNRGGGAFGIRDEVQVAWKQALGWDARRVGIKTPGERMAEELAEARTRIRELESRSAVYSPLSLEWSTEREE